MKVGELYDLAKQLFPSITKRQFTAFYNLAMEQVSRKIRLKVIDMDYEDDTFLTIPTTLVRLEEIGAEADYRYSISNNVLHVYDSDNNELTSVPGLHVKYWSAIINAISDIIDNRGFISDEEFQLTNFRYSEINDGPQNEGPDNAPVDQISPSLVTPEDGASIMGTDTYFTWSFDTGVEVASNIDYRFNIYESRQTNTGTIGKGRLVYYADVDSVTQISPVNTPGVALVNNKWEATKGCNLIQGNMYCWDVTVSYIPANSSELRYITSAHRTLSVLNSNSYVTDPLSSVYIYDIYGDSFTVSVDPLKDIDQYLISVATDKDFTTILPGWENKPFAVVENTYIPGVTSVTVTELTQNTMYFVRCFAQYLDPHEEPITIQGELDNEVTTSGEEITDTAFICNDTSIDTEIIAIALEDIPSDESPLLNPLVTLGETIRITRDLGSNVIIKLERANDQYPNAPMLEIYNFLVPQRSPAVGGPWSFRRLDCLWEEQDDGYDFIAQLCALYLALYQIAEFSGGTQEQIAMINQRVEQYMHQLRIKYNTSKTMQTIRPTYL